MAADLSYQTVGTLIAGFGNYRVKAAQQSARLAEVPGVDGALLLAFGLRETGLRNIEGGAMWDPALQRWVKQSNPKLMDVGWTQISRQWHAAELKKMPGVRAGTWTPHVAGKTANDGGFCPRFTEATNFTVNELADAVQFATEHKVLTAGRVRFAVAAHNCGLTGALKGYQAGDVDRNTAGQDYSAWVLRHRSIVQDWLKAHPGWQG